MHRGAIILVGGKSQRMGRSKALLPFGSELMIERILRLVGGLVEHRFVVAAADQDLPVLPADVMVARDVRSGRGPLEGLSAGLELGAPWADQFFVCGCDTPFVRPELIEWMFQRMSPDDDAVVPREDDRLHPLLAVYHRRVLPTVGPLLESNELRLTRLLEQIATRVVDVEELRSVDDDLVSFRNLNSPEDYETALRELQQRDRPL